LARASIIFIEWEPVFGLVSIRKLGIRGQLRFQSQFDAFFLLLHIDLLFSPAIDNVSFCLVVRAVFRPDLTPLGTFARQKLGSSCNL
jgi:hypothetical protein